MAEIEYMRITFPVNAYRLIKNTVQSASETEAKAVAT
jgi:hypothetical protein